jgi:hypothetical protein
MRLFSLSLLTAAVAATVTACSKPKPVLPQVDVTNATYQAITYTQPDSAQRILTLQFNGDSTASLMEQVPGKNAGSVNHGHWSADWNTLQMTFTINGKEPETDTLVYEATLDSLVPQKWNKSRYGDKGVVLYRQ